MTLAPESYMPIIRQIAGWAIIAALTWAFTTANANAVHQQKLVAVEKTLESKASKESVDELKREILSRLDRMENKMDRRAK